jgi:pyridoxamine 5'-phosphate oxidase
VPLFESRLPSEPLALFARWYREAARSGAPQPDTMTLATAGPQGPSARMVLFKGIGHGTFIFYSNYDSLKGRDLVFDRRGALVFFWSATRHQVRISGTVARLSRSESLAYFRSRPRGAQISALASRQSRVVPSRQALEAKAAELGKRYPEEVPLPADWGGYALRPRWVEFWESRDDRLHDRIRYVRTPAGGWRRDRLSP